MQVPYFLKKDKQKLLLNNGYTIKYYIPENYFDRGMAYQDGQYLNILGLFLYDVFKNGKKEFSEPKLFYYPTLFTCKHDRIEKGKESLYPNNEYREIIFESEDSEPVNSIATIKNAVIAEKVLKLLLSGGIPPIVEYEEIYKIINDSAILNGISFNNIAGLEGIIVSELCRSISDIDSRFIDKYTAGKCGNKDYVMVNLNDLPKLNNALSALTSYNKNIAVASSLNLSRNNDGSIVSELEKRLMK